MRNQQAEGKKQGPHQSYQQTLKSMMHALSKAKLTLEKVEMQKGTEKEESAPVVGAPLVEEPPQIGVKRPRTE